jgi:hypothetical protein
VAKLRRLRNIRYGDPLWMRSRTTRKFGVVLCRAGAVRRGEAPVFLGQRFLLFGAKWEKTRPNAMHAVFLRSRLALASMMGRSARPGTFHSCAFASCRPALWPRPSGDRQPCRSQRSGKGDGIKRICVQIRKSTMLPKRSAAEQSETARTRRLAVLGSASPASAISAYFLRVAGGNG